MEALIEARWMKYEQSAGEIASQSRRTGWSGRQTAPKRNETSETAQNFMLPHRYELKMWQTAAVGRRALCRKRLRQASRAGKPDHGLVPS